ncbi:hypothetical protein [Curtobacterium luteum]|uniref:Gram-positive cocci surface proteins LPxTG domain-containing protein n=1 Tax=Curtobacterium luteum TaxID=33881 RepID=A0A175RGW7_9MICO|nr:hypothetical protein [Curtobacterium luteum]KTR02079.1 hypothetical protein NS184_16940 [Curtobacterium luteum]
MRTTTFSPRRRAGLVAATAIAIVTVGSGAAFGVPAANAATDTATSTSTSAPAAGPTTTGSTATGTTSTGTTSTSTSTSTGTTPAPDASTPLAFTEPSTKADPLALTATVGTPFSHTFHTTGGNGTVGYAIQDAPTTAWTVNVDTGVLSTTPTTPGTYDFEVVALSGGTQVTEYVRVTVAPSPVSFTEPSTKAKPLALTATAGATFTHTFQVVGGSGSTAYAIQDAPSSRFTVNVSTGVLTSTETTAGTYDFEVVALRGTATATEYVRLTVRPAAPVGVETFVGTGKPGSTAYEVAPNGSIERFSGTGKDLGRVSSVPVQQNGTLVVAGLAVDRFGNPTVPDLAAGQPLPTLTSSVASDRIVPDATAHVVRVTFPHASQHRLTVTQDGVSTSFTVAVQPLATAAVATSATGTGATLAYTGADERTPIAWGAGLLAAGATLLGFRLRRRRL